MDPDVLARRRGFEPLTPRFVVCVRALKPIGFFANRTKFAVNRTKALPSWCKPNSLALNNCCPTSAAPKVATRMVYRPGRSLGYRRQPMAKRLMPLAGCAKGLSTKVVATVAPPRLRTSRTHPLRGQSRSTRTGALSAILFSGSSSVANGRAVEPRRRAAPVVGHRRVG